MESTYDRLREVKEFFLDRSPAARVALVAAVREDRLVRKTIPKAEKAKKKAQAAKLEKIAGLLKKMDPNVVEVLLK